MRRTLVLKREALTELTTAELGAVAGGALTPHCPTQEYGCRVPTDHCASIDYTCLLSRHMEPCLSNPCDAG